MKRSWGSLMKTFISMLVLGIFAAPVLSTLTFAAPDHSVGQASFRMCTKDSCVAVDAARAFESRKDHSMTFFAGTVSFYDRKTKKLLSRSVGDEVTWKPETGQLWVTSADGELNIYNFK